MRVLLIATNRQNSWMSQKELQPLPIGLACVAAYINPKRHSLRVLDLMFASDALAETAAVVDEFHPQLVGLSIRNLDNGSCADPQSALPFTKEVVQEIRRNSDATIACGGPAFSALPRDCLQYLEADVGLVGNTPEVFAQLADRVAQGQPYYDLAGIIYRKDGEIIVSPTRHAASQSRPPRLKELDLARYRKAGFGIGVITKMAPMVNGGSRQKSADGQQMAIRPVHEVLTEVSRLRNRYGLQEVFFIDPSFGQPAEYARELCCGLIDAGLNIRWCTRLKPGGCDPEIVSLMVQAGCQKALINGVMVDEPMTLHQAPDSVKLATELVGLQRLCEMCHSQGLPYSLVQNFGELGETENTVRTKLAFLSSLARSNTDASIILRAGNRILPGTPLASQARHESLIASESDLLMPMFYIARPVRETLLPTLRAAVASNPAWQVV